MAGLAKGFQTSDGTQYQIIPPAATENQLGGIKAAALSGAGAENKIGTDGKLYTPYDTTPTSGSTNLVTSGGVYDATHAVNWTTPSIYNSRMTNVTGGYCVVGGVCYVDIEATAAVSHSGSQILFTGVPVPARTNAALCYVATASSFDDAISENGACMARYGNIIIPAITNGYVYHISGSYPVS